MGGIISILMALFGVGWLIAAAQTGFWLLILFGMVFIAVAVIQAIYNFKNATSQNRYSAFDVTEDGEEEDPLNVRFGGRKEAQSPPPEKDAAAYCPYCGAPVGADYEYCRKCGKRLPE